MVIDQLQQNQRGKIIGEAKTMEEALAQLLYLGLMGGTTFDDVSALAARGDAETTMVTQEVWKSFYNLLT